MTQIIGSHNTGVLDGSLNLLARSDATNNGTLADGVDSLVNVANGNLVYQERDAFLPSLGPDFDLVRSYNSRGVIPGTFDGWSYSVAVKLETHNDFLAGGKTQRNFTVTYGDQSVLHFDFDAAGNRWVSTDGSGAYEVLTELSGGGATGAAYLVVREDQSQYRFDKQGALLSITDPNGVTMSFTYQGGKLRTVQDDSGHTITFVQSGTQLERITKTSATDASVVTLVLFGYVQSQLTSVTDRMGHVTRYSYDTNGMLVGVSLPFQQTVNGVAQNWEQRNLSFSYERFYWDDKPHLITPFDQGYSYILKSMTDALGGVTTFDYNFQFAGAMVAPDRDLAYKPNGAREFIGGSTRVVDALGNARATSNAAEFVAWRTANGFYATYGATSPQAQVDAIRNAQSVVYSFDPNSQITQVVDQLGFKTSYAYDAKGNLASLTDRNGFAAITRDDQAASDGYYRKLRVELGFADQPISFLMAQANWASVQAQILAKFTATFTYDARGNQTSATDGAGNKSTSTFTAFNKVASSTSAMGHALAELDTADVQAKRIELGYAGPLTGLSAANKSALVALYTTTYAYDAKQNLTLRTDAGGDITRFEYDTNGNLTKRTVVMGGSPLNDQVTTYSYDPYGNVKETRDGENHLTTQVFDTFGNLLSSVDPRGGVTSLAYDADNRLLSTRTPEGRFTANAYDAVGNRIAITDFAGKTVTQVFDRNNMLLAVIDPALNNNTAANRSTTFQYDILGNRTQSTDAEGRVANYRFDSRRLMVDVTTPQVLRADDSTSAYVSSFGYDGEGNVITLTDNNGNTTQTQYTSIGLTRRITDALGNITQFTHDANLNQIQVVIGAQFLVAGQRRVLNYSYDEEDQLIDAVDALDGHRRSSYDAAGNVVAVTDENGNTTQFTFDRNNRSIKETMPADALGVVHTRLHQWDGNGNEVLTTDEKGDTTRYAFDKDDRQVMLTDGNGINTVFEYDSRNNTTKIAIGVVASYNAATAKVTISDATLGQVETYTYDGFNQLVSHTDAVGNALASSDSPVAQAMRTEMGKSALVSGLLAGEAVALRAQFTENYTYDRVGNRLTETDHLGRVTTYAYDTLDRLQTRTDVTGNALQRSVSYRYDGNSNQVRSVDAKGRVASYQFDAEDRIVQTTDALGVVTKFEYDHVGNKVAQTLAFGTADARKTSFIYDLNDRLLSETDPELHTQGYEYDAVGNRTRVTDARGNSTQYVYDRLNRNIRVTDPLSLATNFEYDGVGNNVKIIDPKGGIRSLKYDGGDRYIETTDAEARITRYAYDVLGNTVGITTAFGRPEAETSTFAYDAEGNLRSATDAAGNVSRSGYDTVYNTTRIVDGNGHITTTEFDALNRQIKVTDPLLGQTLYTYDAVDNKLTETDALNRVRSFAYDAGDRTITQTDAFGVQTTFVYDRVGNQTSITQAANRPGEERATQFFFDKDDQLVRQLDPLGGDTKYEYDANHNVTKVTDSNGHATQYAYDADNRVTSITEPLGFVTQYRYDANGNRNQVIDANGGRTTFYFNGNNEVARTFDAMGFVTTRSYDGNGNLIAETQFANGVAVPADPPPLVAPAVTASAADQTTRFGYDAMNRMTSRTSPLGHVQSMAYDAVGNKTSETDENGHTTLFRYDANDRLDRRTNALGNFSSFTYDAVGNQLTETDDLARLTTATFDLENRQLTSTNALNGLRSFSYDAVGNRLSDTDELGRMTSFEYDLNDRLAKQTDALNGFKAFVYDAVGNRTSTRDENNHVTSFVYDANNRLTSQVDPLLKSRNFEYDALGNQTAVTDENNHKRSAAYDLDNRLISETDALLKVRSYTYDAVGNLVTQTDERGVGFTTQFAYDADNRQVRRTDPLGAVRHYAYDGVGNKTGETDENGHTTSFTYDALDRVTKQTNPLSPTNFKTFAYDAVGNQTGQTDENGHTTNFDYDALDRLVTRTDALGGTNTFTYDAVGNRLSDTDERGETTSFEYDVLDRIKKQTDALGGEKTYTYDAVGNRLTEVNENNRTTTFAYDANDRVTSEVDPLSHSRTLTYDDAGNIKTQTDENGKTVTFTYDANDRVTQQQDPIGATQFAYDPAGNKTGQTDPNGNTTTYAYDANNRQTSKTDPLTGVYGYEYDPAGNKTKESDENGHQASYTYDANDRLVKVVDGEGYESTIAYDAAGNALQRKQELDLNDASKLAVTTEKFDDLNRLVGTLTADGRLMKYEYDAAGNMTRKTEHDDKYPIPATTTVPAPHATDPGRKTDYGYDDLGRRTSEKSPESIVTTYSYDPAGNRTGEKTADGTGQVRDKKIGYDNANRITSTADAMNTVTRFVLDNRGNVLEQHVAFNTTVVRITKYEYDANNRVTKETDAENIVTTFTYNAAGDMTSRTRAGRVESFEYDKNHRLTVEVNGEGNRTEYKYDGAGNRTEVRAGVVGATAVRVLKFEYDESDHLTAEVDGAGNRTVHRYDGAGNRIETIQNALAPLLAQQRRSSFEYDADNRLTKVVNAEGGVTRYQYDALGNQVEIIGPTGAVTRNKFDMNGRITENVVDALGTKGGIKTVNVYDLHGNVLNTTVSFGDGSDARTLRYSYDLLDRQTAVTDGEGFTTAFDYDVFGNQTRIRSGLYLLAAGDAGYDAAKAARAHTSEMIFSYDKLDRLTDTKQITVNATSAGDTLHSSYDAFGNRLTQTTGFGGAGPRTVRFTYDQANQLVRRDSAAGGVLKLEYDAAGNQTAKFQLQSGTENTISAVWIEQRLDYDGNGQLIADRNVLNASTTLRTEHHLDAFGNVVETVIAQGTADQRTTRFEYNDNNDLIARIDAFGTPEARRTAYGVDAAGRTVKETDALGRVNRFYFDGAGRQLGTLDAGGYYTQFVPDSQGNVTQSLSFSPRYLDATPGQYDALPPTPAGTDDVSVIQNTYDRVNNLVEQVLADGNRMTYGFDANRKLIVQTNFGSSDAARIALTANQTPLALSFTYDDALRLKTFVNADGSIETYAYDSANNQTSESIANPSSLPGGRTDPVRTTTFSYDGDNRMVEQRFDPTGLNLVTTVSYDKAGNVVSRADALSHATLSSYDRLNRLTSVTDPTGGQTVFGYDLAGNRVSVRNSLLRTTDLSYDHLNQLLVETLPAVNVYTVDGGLVPNVRPTRTLRYDAVGNIVQEIDENAGVTTRWYDANDNVIAELDPENVLRTASFDSNGSALTSTLYMTRLAASAHNPAVLPSLPGGTGADAPRTMTLEYDRGNRVVRAVMPQALITTLANTGTSNPSALQATVALDKVNRYDRFGNLVNSRDEAGRNTYGYYDALGRQLAAVDAEGFLIESAYDDQAHIVQQHRYATALVIGNISAANRPEAPAGAVAVVDRIYDAASRLIEEISPATQLTGGPARVTTRYNYDAAGNLSSRTLAAGTSEAQTEYYWYDSANRQTAVVNAARTLHTFDYDAGGNQTRQSRFYNAVPAAGPTLNLATATLAQLTTAIVLDPQNDQRTTLAYDALNRVTRESHNVAGGGATPYAARNLDSSYDAIGNATLKTDGDGFQTKLAYNTLGYAVRTVTPDGTTSFVQYNAAGEKTLNWTGVLGANGAVAATAVAASIGSALNISWNVGGGDQTSYVVFGTTSRSDTAFESNGSVYGSVSGTVGSGAVSVGIPLAQFTAGQTVYFRVVSVDPGGSQAWTEERSVIVPARLTALSTRDVGANLRVTVSFNGAVTSPQLLYGSTSLTATANFNFVSGNTWNVDIPENLAGVFALRWTFGASTYTTTAAAFGGTGVHSYDPATKSAQWTLPSALTAAQGLVADQVIVVDGVRIANGQTFNGTISFDPKLTTNGVHSYDVLYGTEVATAHTVGVSNQDVQTTTVNDVITATEGTRTYTYHHNYRTNVSATLNADETATVAPGTTLHVAYRVQAGGAGFTGDLALTKNVNTYSGTIFALAPNTYDLKVYYVNASGNEVVVEWRRITVAATSLPANVVQVDSATPFDFAGFSAPPQPTVTTFSQTFNGTSVQVLARELNGSMTRSGAGPNINIAITAGAYSGPLGTDASPFALGVAATAGTNGGERTSNGLLAQTYFTEIEYNALGFVVASNEEGGLWRRYGVDARGNKVQTQLYGSKADEIANLTPIVSHATYDARNLETARFGPAVTVDGGATQRPVTRMSYDFGRRLLSELDPNPGAVPRLFTYDGAGNRVTETNSIGQLTRYAYDRLGHAVLVTDPLLHARRRQFDSAGRMTGEVDATNQTTSFAYDAFDRVVSRTDAVGLVTRYTYDRRDRLVQVTDTANQTSSYAYDRRDNRTRTIDVAGHTETTGYDNMSRVVSQTTASAIVSGGAVLTLVQRYGYDAYGNRSSETDAEGRTRRSSYGAAGRLVSLTDEGGRVTQYTYDRFGRAQTETGNGKNITRSYNNAGWLTQIVDTGTIPSTTTTTTYDIGGNRKTEVVTQVTASIPEIMRNIAYTHDGLGRLTRWADSVTGENLNYSWDGAGNQVQVRSDNFTSTFHAYSYDANDRLSLASGETSINSSYTYDAAGRRSSETASGARLNFTYDALNRPTRASDNANVTRATWTYDALGNVLEYKEYKAGTTTLLRHNTNTYFENGLAKTSRSIVTEDVNDDDKKKDNTTTSEYDKTKRLIKQTLLDQTDSDSDNHSTTTYTFTYTADGRTTSVAGSSTTDASGNSTSTYDANDHLVRIDKGKGDESESTEYLTFNYDNDGHIVKRFHDDGEEDTTTSPTTRFIYALGEPVGEKGTNTSNATVTLLDENGTSGDKQEMQYNAQHKIDKDHPAATVSTYSARAGDSLQSVAAAVYGNPSLWFLIADASGLTGKDTLKAGQTLQVPTSIESGRLNTDSHVLYKESDIIGSKLPNLKSPDSGDNTCALIGAIILLILVAIIAIVVTVVTAGIAAPAMIGAIFGAAAVAAGTVSTLATVVITVAVTAVIGAVVAAAASAISQGILIGFGLQKEFDWKQFAADIVVGFISGAVSGLGQALQLVKIASTVAKVANVAAQAALEAAGEVARQAIANDGVIDNPWTILAAGAGGAFGAIASRAVRVEAQVARRVSVLTTKVDDVATLAGKAKSIVTQVDKKLLAQFGEGASVFKTGTTKFVRTVDSAGQPALKQVARTAFSSKTPKTILKFKDATTGVGRKLVKIGDDIVDVPRISSQFTRTQRVTNNLSRFASTAADAVKALPGKIVGVAKTAAGKITSFASTALDAVKSLPSKAADAWDSAKLVARTVRSSIATGVRNFVDSATTAVRKVGRAITELPARIAKSASEAWSSTKTLLKTVRDGLKSFAQTAAAAVKALPGKVKTGVQDLAQSFTEWRKSGTVFKGKVTKTVRSFEDGPAGRVEKFTQVARESFTKKGYKTLAKADGVNGLPPGTKLVRVGDEVQTWRRVSSQYTTTQRISRYFAKKSVLNKLAGDQFKVEKSITKFDTTKIVRTGFARTFNEATQSFDEVATYAVRRRLVTDGLDKTTKLVQGIKAVKDAAVSALSTAGRTAVEALRKTGRGIVSGVDKVSDGLSKASAAAGAFVKNDLPLQLRVLGGKVSDGVSGFFSRWNLLKTAGDTAFVIAKGALRDYKDDRAGGSTSALIFIGKNAALSALKQPRADLNNWLLNQSVSGIGQNNETLKLGLLKASASLTALEKNHGWWPEDWISTSAAAVSRVQSPIDLDYNASREQQLRTSRMTAGQTFGFELRSVFDFEADLNGRIVNNDIPLLALGNLPPAPGMGLSG